MHKPSRKLPFALSPWLCLSSCLYAAGRQVNSSAVIAMLLRNSHVELHIS
ncbi:hypothetical protein [Paenibacillus antibioticophila]|nr:hypothetical protein [Paenibacillus antibioticophila]